MRMERKADRKRPRRARRATRENRAFAIDFGMWAAIVRARCRRFQAGPPARCVPSQEIEHEIDPDRSCRKTDPSRAGSDAARCLPLPRLPPRRVPRPRPPTDHCGSARRWTPMRRRRRPVPEMITQLVPLLFDHAHRLLHRAAAAAPAGKEQKDALQNVRRGDTVVTTGGLVGKVTKTIDDAEVEVEIAQNVRVRVLRHAIAEVRAKGEPVQGSSRRALKRWTPSPRNHPQAGKSGARANSRPARGRLAPLLSPSGSRQTMLRFSNWKIHRRFWR